MKIETAQIHFLGDVALAVPIIYLQFENPSHNTS